MAKKKRRTKEKRNEMLPHETTGHNTPRQSDGTSGDDRTKYELNDANDNIRCTHLTTNGNQCKAWSRVGYIFCRKHAGMNIVGSGAGTAKAAPSEPRYRFHTDELNDFYKGCLDNPEYLALNDEIALIRTASQITMRVAKARLENAAKISDDAKKMAAENASALMLTEMASSVSELVDKAARVHKAIGRMIDVEVIDAFIEHVTLVLAQEITDVEALSRVVLRMRSSEVPTGGVRRIFDWPVGSKERTAFDKAKAAQNA